MLAGLLVAIPVCMGVGYTLERVAYRPLRRAPRLAPLITAIGLSIILQHLALIIWSRNPLPYPQIIKHGLVPPQRRRPDGATITNVQIAIIVGSFAMMGALLLLVYKTKLGIAMRATAQNQQVAGLMGIDINRVISLTFVIGAALGAVAGVMVGSYYGIAHYQMGFILGPEGVLGGGAGRHRQPRRRDAGRPAARASSRRSARATSATSRTCATSPAGRTRSRSAARADSNLTLFGSNYQDVFAFLVLIAVLVFRPSGLLGERVSDRA